jgi:hypothetical protein
MLHLQNKHSSFPKVLYVRYIPSPHTADNIAKCYRSILGDYSLSPEDLFKVVCDYEVNNSASLSPFPLLKYICTSMQ